MEELSNIKNKIIELRQNKGYTIEETIKKLHISRKIFTNLVTELKNSGEYDEEKIKKAMKKKRNQINYNKNKVKLSPEEEEYRKKCIDLMCKRYFNYEQTHRFNPVLVQKLQILNNICSYKVIFNTIRVHQKNLDYANTKVFSSEYQKISYMMTIIRNNVNNVSKRIQRKEQINKSNTIENDNQFLNLLNKNVVSKPVKRKDLSFLLDDE